MPLLKPRHRDDLTRQGYTVVKGVLTAEECQHYVTQYVNWIDHNFSQGEFPFCNNSLIQRYSIGHLFPSWSARLKAKDVFAELWGTQELLTSVDAVAIGRPPEDGCEEFHNPDLQWLHVDQGPGRLGLHAYQGGLYLETANMDDWVFECLDESHKLLERFYAEHPEERAQALDDACDYRRLQDSHVKWFRDQGCLKRRVPVPKGGLLLWDSRLVHNNVRPIKGRANPGRWRFVVMMSMGPARWADAVSLRLKRRAFRELRMTTHWPCNGVRLFPKVLPEGATRAKHPLKAQPTVAKTLDVLQLAGVVPYKKLQKKTSAAEATTAAANHSNGTNNDTPYVPRFSPDYKPPRQPPSSSPCCGVVVVAVVSVVVCAVSAAVYYYINLYDQPEEPQSRFLFF